MSALRLQCLDFENFRHPPCCTGDPLNSQRWPLQSMRHDCVIQEGGIAFPYFVLFIDYLFLGISVLNYEYIAFSARISHGKSSDIACLDLFRLFLTKARCWVRC